jgi:hypothetical protein
MIKNKIILLSFLIMQVFSQDVYDGLLLFSPTAGGGGINGITYLMDNNENIVHTWNFSNGAASMPYLMPDSSIVYPYRVSNPTMNSGGVGGGVAQLSWDGEVLWNYVVSNSVYQHHHDVEPLPNGNILIIAWENFSWAEAQEMGRTSIDNPLNQMWSEAILEYNPTQDEIVWEWHLWDHLVQDIDEQFNATYGNISDHPELFNINQGNVGSNGGPGGPNADWMHINAIAYNEELDQIVFSSRHQDEIFIIDHSTTTEQASTHSGGNSGMGGDILYRWGNPQNYGRGTNSDHILDSQHGVNWIKSGYSGEGNLILFNNGFTNNASAGMEFITPLNDNGTYDIENNEPFGPTTVEWYFSQNGMQTGVQGGAFRLPNGNTIITEADDAIIYEVNPDGDVVWNYTYSGNNSMIARCTKYDLSNLGGNYILYGDVNFDNVINVLDVIQVINFILGVSTPTAEQLISADMNEDALVNVTDIVMIVNYILNN